MAEVKGFLGQDLAIPEDRRYHASHFWVRPVSSGAGSGEIELGITSPGIALTGGLVELEVLAEPGAAFVVSEEIAFATTRKAIKYFLSPLAGTVTAVNAAADAASTNADPYNVWLIRAAPAAGWDRNLIDAPTYAAKLAASEHATPEAAAAAKAGRGSPTCKSIYTGIKE